MKTIKNPFKDYSCFNVMFHIDTIIDEIDTTTKHPFKDYN